jgi:hypothetical protein
MVRVSTDALPRWSRGRRRISRMDLDRPRRRARVGLGPRGDLIRLLDRLISVICVIRVCPDPRLS